MFEEIEARRILAGIRQKDLCARAKVHQTTFSARKRGRSGMQERNIKKLSAALEQLISEREEVLNELESCRS